MEKIIKLIANKLFLFDQKRKRKIKKGPLKNYFYYGTYYDKRYFETFEKEIVNLIKNIITDGNVYDVGAHYGFYSSLFSTLTEGTVYSFEPNPYCLKVLKKNLEINNFNKVKLFDFGLGDEEKGVEMSIILDNLARSTCEDKLKDRYEKGEHKIEKVRVGIRVLDNLNLPEPKLVKIDVEGFEVKVIKGMAKTIGSYLPDFIIETHGKDKEDTRKTIVQILEFLKEFGYYCMSVENNYLINEIEDAPMSGHLYASVNKDKVFKIINLLKNKKI